MYNIFLLTQNGNAVLQIKFTNFLLYYRSVLYFFEIATSHLVPIELPSKIKIRNVCRVILLLLCFFNKSMLVDMLSHLHIYNDMLHMPSTCTVILL